jgi:predicted ester cyclase
MDAKDLAALYRNYLAYLNGHDLTRLEEFVDDDVIHNDRKLGVAGYRDMLEADFRAIPDLTFAVELLVSEPPRLASRLRFDCHPRAEFLGLPIDGKRIIFTESVFYAFSGSRIARVWSVIDKAAIEAQLGRD